MPHTETSKILSHVLRHAPEDMGVAMDGERWIPVDERPEKAKALDASALSHPAKDAILGGAIFFAFSNPFERKH